MSHEYGVKRMIIGANSGSILTIAEWAIPAILAASAARFVIRRRRGRNPVDIDESQFDPALVNNVRYQIVPYIISAQRLPKLPQYTVYKLYSYIRALLAGIVGLGIAPPVLQWVNKAAQVSSSANEHLAAPPGLGFVAAGAAVVLVAFSVYVTQTGLDKRTVLAESCSDEFKGLYAKLLSIVGSADIESQLDVLANQIATVVQRHIAAKDWVFEGVVAPGIEKRVQVMTNEVLTRIQTRRGATPPGPGPAASSPGSKITIQQVEN